MLIYIKLLKKISSSICLFSNDPSSDSKVFRCFWYSLTVQLPVCSIYSQLDSKTQLCWKKKTKTVVFLNVFTIWLSCSICNHVVLVPFSPVLLVCATPVTKSLYAQTWPEKLILIQTKFFFKSFNEPYKFTNH